MKRNGNLSFETMDIKKLERRVKSQEEKLAAQAGKLPETTDEVGVDDDQRL